MNKIVKHLVFLLFLTASSLLVAKDYCGLDVPFLKPTTLEVLSSQVDIEYLKSKTDDDFAKGIYLHKLVNEKKLDDDVFSLDFDSDKDLIVSAYWRRLQENDDMPQRSIRKIKSWEDKVVSENPAMLALMQLYANWEKSSTVNLSGKLKYLTANDPGLLMWLGARSHQAGDYDAAYHYYLSALKNGELTILSTLSILTYQLDENCYDRSRLYYAMYKNIFNK